MAEFDLHQDKLTRPPNGWLEKVPPSVKGNHLKEHNGVDRVLAVGGAVYGWLQDLTVQ